MNATPSELRYKKKVNEKLYFGQPQRIWRGKILKVLHENGMNGSTETTIGKEIQTDFSAQRIPWLRQVLNSLIIDELIVKRRQRIYLP